MLSDLSQFYSAQDPNGAAHIHRLLFLLETSSQTCTQRYAILHPAKLTKTINHPMCTFIFPYRTLHLCSTISLGFQLLGIKTCRN